MKFNVVVKNEAGFDEALLGLSFNKKQFKDMYPVAKKLYKMDYGHNKFLESIQLWIEVTAPRYWWQEADTYRLSTKQSESTVHTLLKEIDEIEHVLQKEINELKEKYFESCVSTKILRQFLLEYKVKKSQNATKKELLLFLKSNLPEGFMQKRLWCMSYKTLRNIVLQRQSHVLPHWQLFIKEVMSQIEHPELVVENFDEL